MMHRSSFEFARIIAIVAVSALIAAMQMTDSESGEPGRSAGATFRSAAHTVADASLRKAAAALPKIRQINAEMIQALSHADSRGQRRKIVSKAKDKQLVALDEAGITAHQYEETITAAENDPHLFAKLEEYVNTEQTC
jgi:long-subunit fatty acid transport protein